MNGVSINVKHIDEIFVKKDENMATRN